MVGRGPIEVNSHHIRLEVHMNWRDFSWGIKDIQHNTPGERWVVKAPVRFLCMVKRA